MDPVKYENACALIESLIIIKGVASKGKNKGNTYELVTVDKGDIFRPATVRLAKACGVRVIDTTSNG